MKKRERDGREGGRIIEKICIMSTDIEWNVSLEVFGGSVSRDFIKKSSIF
jgi:hypothetical protein